MNVNRALGDTWRTRYGSRVGVQVRSIRGVPEPVQLRTAVWSSDGSAVLGECEWTLTSGKLCTSTPADNGQWAALVAKTAFQKALQEAPSQRAFFEDRIRKAPAFYTGMYAQSKSVPEILAHAKGQIGNSAPAATKWLVERARRYAVKFEGYEAPEKTKSQRRERTYEEAPVEVPVEAPQSVFDKVGSTLGISGEIVKNAGIAAGVVAVAYPILRLLGGSRAET